MGWAAQRLRKWEERPDSFIDFWDPSMASSDPSLSLQDGDEWTAAGHLPSVIMVFAHHPEGDAYGDNRGGGSLESLALLSSWGD